MSSPDLTINVTVYNGAEYLNRCLDSLLAQTFTNFKVMITDNASTDGSGQIAREYVRRDSRFFYHLNPENMGQRYSLARVLFNTDSKYYALVHCDLSWAPTYAEECIKALEEDPQAVLAYSHCLFIKPDGTPESLWKDIVPYDDPDPAVRYFNLVNTLGWCTAFHGIGRPLVMAKMTMRFMQTANAAGDNQFLALMALAGKLIQIEKPLFFRIKSDYQSGRESTEKRFERLYSERALGLSLPFCNWIRDHCFDLIHSDLPPEKIDGLINKIMASFMANYKHMLKFELEKTIARISDGDLKRSWGGDDKQLPASSCAMGLYKNLDFVYLAELSRDLDYAYNLLPKFPGLNYARAVVMLCLGHKNEAREALKVELANDPLHVKARELISKL